MGGGGHPRGVPQPSPLTLLWQGLLPLVELSICPLEGSREHAFQITGVRGHEWSQPQGGPEG